MQKVLYRATLYLTTHLLSFTSYSSVTFTLTVGKKARRRRNIYIYYRSKTKQSWIDIFANPKTFTQNTTAETLLSVLANNTNVPNIQLIQNMEDTERKRSALKKRSSFAEVVEFLFFPSLSHNNYVNVVLSRMFLLFALTFI